MHPAYGSVVTFGVEREPLTADRSSSRRGIRESEKRQTMPHANTRDEERPTTEEIRAALDRIAVSEAFCASPQLVAFLRYVVEATLRGSQDRIKGYTIAVEAFGRGDDFNPQDDPIVRFSTNGCDCSDQNIGIIIVIMEALPGWLSARLKATQGRQRIVFCLRQSPRGSVRRPARVRRQTGLGIGEPPTDSVRADPQAPGISSSRRSGVSPEPTRCPVTGHAAS